MTVTFKLTTLTRTSLRAGIGVNLTQTICGKELQKLELRHKIEQYINVIIISQ